MIYSKQDITFAIEEKFSAFSNYVAAQDEIEFVSAPARKWAPGQHLDHLIKTTRPVNIGLGLPSIICRIMFGKPNRKERSYEELVEKYKGKLTAGAKAPRIFVPPAVSFKNKNEKIENFLSQKEKLKRKIASFSEDQLSSFLLPHPLLGKLTLREMLYFTAYHTEHHLELIKKYRLQ